jgi:hypothetical protein
LNADLEEGRDNLDAELEAAEKERADLEAALEKENADLEKEKKADLEATLAKENADLEAEILELKLEHKQDYKGIWDLYNEGLDENSMQQHQQIIELEFENENLKEQIAAMKAGNSEAGASGDGMSEEEQAGQQAEQFATA